MSNTSDTNAIATVAPPAGLTALGERLVGTWKVSGEAEGETSWEWMEGGFFLIQRGWTHREGAEHKYIQIIGRDRMPDAETADAITGRLYTDHGDTLAYVCELDGDTMTIWARKAHPPCTPAPSAPTATRSRAAGSGQAAATARR